MGRTALVVGGSLLAFSACGAFESDPIDGPQEGPFVDEWRVELVAPFVHQAAGEPRIESLRIGGREFEGNFANRGDVVVEFADVDTITVELRRFTTAVDPDLAEEDFDRLQLWTYVTEGDAPLRPDDMVVSKPCVGDDGGLRDGCAVRVLYDGGLQPVRLGTDIRVTLPSDYVGEVKVVTEDNAVDGGYPNRGNICFGPGAASLDASLEHGIAMVQPGPGGPEPQRINVKGEAAEIIIDVPAAVESVLSAAYTTNRVEGLLCGADITAAGFILVDGVPDASIRGTAGPRPHTGNAALEVGATARDCQYIQAVESPDAFAQLAGQPAPSELRGNVQLCDGCLGGASCSALLPR